MRISDWSSDVCSSDLGAGSARICLFPGVEMRASASAGAAFRAALTAESPPQVMGAITAYDGLMARRTGYRALYLSGGGVAANSLGMPALGISTMADVLIDARRIADATVKTDRKGVADGK